MLRAPDKCAKASYCSLKLHFVIRLAGPDRIESTFLTNSDRR